MSKRKPHNQDAGYVCERINPRTGIGHVVIYDRQKGFVGDAEGRWVIVCSTHNTLTSASSLKVAREVMKAVDFCEDCMNGQNLAVFTHPELLEVSNASSN